MVLGGVGRSVERAPLFDAKQQVFVFFPGAQHDSKLTQKWHPQTVLDHFCRICRRVLAQVLDAPI
jgi:hypothetical protein